MISLNINILTSTALILFFAHSYLQIVSVIGCLVLYFLISAILKFVSFMIFILSLRPRLTEFIFLNYFIERNNCLEFLLVL